MTYEKYVESFISNIKERSKNISIYIWGSGLWGKYAKELLDKPNGAIMATLDENEFVIDNIKRIITSANKDDTVTQWTLNLRDGGNGNLKR